MVEEEACTLGILSVFLGGEYVTGKMDSGRPNIFFTMRLFTNGLSLSRIDRYEGVTIKLVIGRSRVSVQRDTLSFLGMEEEQEFSVLSVMVMVWKKGGSGGTVNCIFFSVEGSILDSVLSKSKGIGLKRKLVGFAPARFI